MSDYISRQMLGTNLAEVGTNSATKRTVKGFPIDADLLMLKVEEKHGFMARDRLYEIIRYMPKYELPSAQPDENKYEYHYDHTDCIWYQPGARNRCNATCSQYRDGWNDAMNYIFRDGEGYRPFRRDKKYEG